MPKQSATKKLINRYQIHITDRDIYAYANRVARKNGYKRISFSALREKNPNWIFPGNVFRMLDEEKITVRKGDTLWELSHDKLMDISINLYSIIEKIRSGQLSDKAKKRSIKKARAMTFNKNHKKIIDTITKNSANTPLPFE